MNMPFGHQQLHNRYCFEGELELVTALRISSGNASDETDAPFIRTFDKTTPYIPGSSLRGAIRSEVERILASVGATAGLKSCTLFEKDCCTEKARDFLSELDKNERNQDTREKSTKNELIAAFAKDTLCDVCKLFGSTVYASRLTIEDALPVGMEGNKIPTHIRDGVGIDRDTGAAKDGAKFDYEVIEPAKNGLAFLFKMKAENVTNNDKKLRQNSGMGSPTECLTLSSAEWTAFSEQYPSGGDVSSLSDILETGDVPERYYLSAIASLGILRRAAKRGRVLPRSLQTALEQVAQTTTKPKPDTL